LLDAFAACFAVKVTFFSSEMEELSVGLRNPGSSYCRFVQNDLKLLYQCHATDREMCHRAASQGKPFRYHCHAGLIEAVRLIRLEGKTIGTLMVGQIRDTGSPPDHILAAWTKKHGSEDEILGAWNQLSPFDAAMLENMLKLFTMLVEFIVSQNYVTLREGVLIERILKYIENRIGEPVSLSEAAKELARSQSAISHALRKKLDLSFGRLVALKKIERFEMILQKDPSLTIQEAAARVGYQDSLYFSRLYKKLRLVPPSLFLASARRSSASEKNAPAHP